ncbi:(2Fe-2S)-binding protein [Noviherbaspirillum sp.]|jgi:aerobic-type carbon monoxide dehydrogenase small subunit (CoxS/CutS family)|uniref:(2Fe-2S)-binding protein n=1 Tax=Noviherbaspirillum sp. TaxID=1926288 RepID=UPI0025D6214A|nr:(2Fe-2S)-binding protein [Noviherbaspirillum sp.]
MLQIKSEERKAITFTLNGQKVTGFAEPRMLLTDFLREQLGLTEIHVGCEHGVCGACTIRINGKVARGCLTFAAQIDGLEVETVQSLSSNGDLSDLQVAFRKHHALQCGYCTPGVLMSTSAFLDVNPNPTEEEIRVMLSGHICRCTGYVGMVHAILEVAETRAKKRAGVPA